MPRLLPSLFGGTRARHDVLLYLEQVAISCRGREEGRRRGRRKRREDRRSNTLWLVHHHVAMVTMSLPHIPQGMCVHCSSSVSVPALTSWMRVGAGGISVSRYQRSLQHTWEWVGGEVTHPHTSGHVTSCDTQDSYHNPAQSHLECIQLTGRGQTQNVHDLNKNKFSVEFLLSFAVSSFSLQPNSAQHTTMPEQYRRVP